MFVICFISQWMKKSKHGLFVFQPKKTLIWRRHRLINWPVMLQYDIKAKYWLINLPQATCVCIRLTNQSNCSISVHLLFLFCLCVFITRSYENHRIILSSMSLIRYYVHYKLSAELLYFFPVYRVDVNQ